MKIITKLRNYEMDENTRFYVVPVLATITAVAFWIVFRDERGFLWWIILIAVIGVGNYLAYFLPKEKS